MTADTNEPRLLPPPTVLGFWVLLIVCAFTRLYDLGARPIMHDEALFTFYTHDMLYKAFTYDYMPILHGPLHMLLNALVWHVFGESDYTMRLASALLGIGGFFWLWNLRPWFGRVGIWVALAFYTISPGLMFFQRFFREDALFVFTTLWMVASAAHWWRARQPRWLVSFLFAATVLFCNKESSLFVYFTFATFMALMVVEDLAHGLFAGKESYTGTANTPASARFPSAWLCGGIVFVFIVLCITRIFEGMHYDADVVEVLHHEFPLAEVSSLQLALGWRNSLDPSVAGALGTGHFWRVFYVGTALALVFFFSIIKGIVNGRLGHREFLARWWSLVSEHRWYVAGAAAICFVLYLAVFTMFFVHPMGPFEIYRKTWSYWGGQHEWGRIPGPFHMHSVNLLIYELPAVLIVVGAWIAGIVRGGWSRATSFAILVALLPVAAFHKILFSGYEIGAMEGGTHPLHLLYMPAILTGGSILSFIALLSRRLSRIAIPAGLVLLTIFSIYFFSSSEWAQYTTSILQRAGKPIELLGRGVTGAEFMEAKLNMDAGWNLWYVIILVAFGTLLSWRSLERGERFHAFLIWWFVTALGAASYAREAVPQVGIHAALPLMLLAASYIDRLAKCSRLWSARPVWIGLFAIFMVWNAKAALVLNFRNYDDVRERMVYGHTPREVRDQARFILQFASLTKTRTEKFVGPANGFEADEWITYYNDPKRQKQVRVFLGPEPIWAMRWYLRDIETTESGAAADAVAKHYEFLFLEPNDAEGVGGVAENYYIIPSRSRRFWTPDPLNPRKMLNLWLALIPSMYVLDSQQAGELAEARAEWRCAWRYLMFREVFDGDGRKYPSISSSDYIFCVRKDLLEKPPEVAP